MLTLGQLQGFRNFRAAKSFKMTRNHELFCESSVSSCRFRHHFELATEAPIEFLRCEMTSHDIDSAGRGPGRTNCASRRALRCPPGLRAVIVPLLGAFLGFSHLAGGHGAYHDVVRELAPKIAKEPANTGLRLRLAEAHVEHEEWRLGLLEIQRIEELAPGKHPLGYLKGTCLALAKRWEPAKVELDGYLGAFPEHEGALCQRARVCKELGDTEGANRDFRKACRTSRDPDLVIEFAHALNEQKRSKEAVAVVRDALGRVPDDPSLLECLVASAIKADDSATVLSAMDDLQRVWPRPEIWMKRRAVYLGETGREAESRAAWIALRDRILALPNLERAQPLLAELLADSQKALGESVPQAVIAPPASR